MELWFLTVTVDAPTFINCIRSLNTMGEKDKYKISVINYLES